VGLIGVVFGDGISSTLMNYGSCCSFSYDCACAMVLTLECRVVWIISACFGGAMVVKFDRCSIPVVPTTSVNFVV
jgi:hypothetical protein